ncbi:type II toxin-antitoxin system MqsA family antit oxin [Desulfonema ishimotonii]|uniref:Type II toxin-antitoxin system MqsA family antit oxin n=1 Tax=Desulfonema ishimotonii TaxID=45657 RepID=A0A401FUA5_9BACT|nr:type II toxin-antitoxin system MqsA family antitoxin [Desulfonema ishimotonii]GBC60567.1 type II toxin-antitoxin system MqsA family antit oxin [Desulfonema ishimotonii]
MYKDGDMCPICGQATLERSVIDETFEYKGREITVSDYVIHTCPECGESVVDPESLRSSEKIIRDFQRRTDGLLTSDEIRRTRKASGFTQEAFGKILGGGVKGFARYENGQVTQSRAMDNLLRIIDRYPFALDVITKGPSAGEERARTFQYDKSITSGQKNIVYTFCASDRYYDYDVNAVGER